MIEALLVHMKDQDELVIDSIVGTTTDALSILTNPASPVGPTSSVAPITSIVVPPSITLMFTLTRDSFTRFAYKDSRSKEVITVVDDAYKNSEF
ncbi:hypothetical protein HAX54_019931 [Datura stramonium]|uniref:Uncharacterized protein n=1 Tax=Datura stramonium TaxID=4076 RepID=A0ABS8USB0_DATST|nr:hypothetical protein [Datura stramonium]